MVRCRLPQGSSAIHQEEARLDLGDALVVLDAVRETCTYRSWFLLAAHVRRTHIHLVVDGIVEPSGAIRDFKAYASRALNSQEPCRRWARGGNARSLANARAVNAAAGYVAGRVRRWRSMLLPLGWVFRMYSPMCVSLGLKEVIPFRSHAHAWGFRELIREVIRGARDRPAPYGDRVKFVARDSADSCLCRQAHCRDSQKVKFSPPKTHYLPCPLSGPPSKRSSPALGSLW